MAEQVNIASLTIDVDDVVKESAKLKKQIDSLKESQKELKDSGQETTEQYQKQDAEIKRLNKAYRDNQKFVESLDAANEDLNKTLQVEGKSRQELLQSRAQLNQISKQIIGNTEEEVELREKLNATIDEQTQKIKELSPGYIKQKEEIGAYTEGINAADFNLRSLISNSTEAGGATNLLRGGLKAATQGILSFTKAAVAFIFTPVGAVIAAIAAAFLLVRNAMNRSEESTVKVRKAFAAFEGVLKFALKALEPLGNFLIDVLVKHLENVGKVFNFVTNQIEKGLRRLGFDKAADGINNFTESIRESARATQELVQAELDYEKAQRIARKTQLEFQKDAEKLRQIRDDETKSFSERIKANEELGRVLDKQLNEELALAQKALDLANLRIQLEGETTDALNERAEAETEIVDIQERITGQTSEQLTNRVALIKEFNEETKRLQEEAGKFTEDLLQAELDAEIEAIDEEIALNEGKNEKIIELNREKTEKLLEQERLRRETEAERDAIDLENRFALLALSLNNEFELRRAELERQRQLEIKEAEKVGADVTAINKKYASQQAQIDKALKEARLSEYLDLFGSISKLLGENTKAGKAAGIAQATINTYQGVTEVWKAPSVLPEPFNTISKITATATTLASGLSAVREISGVNTSFAKGTILGGRSHAQGGNKFFVRGMRGIMEHEKGESIINKKSTSMFAPLLSAINFAGGGRKFASGQVGLGGISGVTASTVTNSLIDIDLLAGKIAEANASLPNPIVSVEEINTTASNVSVVENLASD